MRLANDAKRGGHRRGVREENIELNLFNTDRQLSALQTAVKTRTSNEKKVMVYLASGLKLQRNRYQRAVSGATTNAAIRAT